MHLFSNEFCCVNISPSDLLDQRRLEQINSEKPTLFDQYASSATHHLNQRNLKFQSGLFNIPKKTTWVSSTNQCCRMWRRNHVHYEDPERTKKKCTIPLKSQESVLHMSSFKSIWMCFWSNTFLKVCQGICATADRNIRCGWLSLLGSIFNCNLLRNNNFGKSWIGCL